MKKKETKETRSIERRINKSPVIHGYPGVKGYSPRIDANLLLIATTANGARPPSILSHRERSGLSGARSILAPKKKPEDR